VATPGNQFYDVYHAVWSPTVRAFVHGAAMAFVPARSLYVVLCSAVLWTVGFAGLIVTHWPVPTRPRIDGQSG
jgi:hypothetical protein